MVRSREGEDLAGANMAGAIMAGANMAGANVHVEERQLTKRKS